MERIKLLQAICYGYLCNPYSDLSFSDQVNMTDFPFDHVEKFARELRKPAIKFGLDDI